MQYEGIRQEHVAVRTGAGRIVGVFFYTAGVGPAHAQRVQVMAGAPGEVSLQVGAGVQPGLTPAAGQVGGRRRVENTLVRSQPA